MKIVRPYESIVANRNMAWAKDVGRIQSAAISVLHVSRVHLVEVIVRFGELLDFLDVLDTLGVVQHRMPSVGRFHCA